MRRAIAALIVTSIATSSAVASGTIGYGARAGMEVAVVSIRRTRRLFPFVERIFADAGYQGPRVAQAAASTGRWVVEIVKRNELHKFVVLPKRWIVERTLAWISHNRRLARDFERYTRSVAALVRLAMIRLMLRRLTRPYYSVSS